MPSHFMSNKQKSWPVLPLALPGWTGRTQPGRSCTPMQPTYTQHAWAKQVSGRQCMPSHFMSNKQKSCPALPLALPGWTGRTQTGRSCTPMQPTDTQHALPTLLPADVEKDLPVATSSVDECYTYSVRLSCNG